MSLTTGRGPLSSNPAGSFTRPVPDHVVYVEPFRRRVRGIDGGRTVVDSERVLLVHRPGEPPTYAFPTGQALVQQGAVDRRDGPPVRWTRSPMIRTRMPAHQDNDCGGDVVLEPG